MNRQTLNTSLNRANVSETTRLCPLFQMREIALRKVHSHNLSTRPDALCQVNRGKPRSATDIKNLVANTKASTLPCGGRLRGPELMLKSQAFQLGAIRPQHVILFVGLG